MPVRRLVHVLATVLAIAGLPVVAQVAALSPAAAHQDGCHSWHSCPSDSDSYVCGDLGYDDECATFEPDYVMPEYTAPKVDYTAPRRPTFAKPSASAGGAVHIPVRAEQGAELVVRDGSRVVATATGTGAVQTIVLRAATGSHTYRVTATDAAGNRSSAGSVTVVADATPPAADDVVLWPASPVDTRTLFRVNTDPGSRFHLTVDGRTLGRGTTRGGTVEEIMDLANGRHSLRLQLRDAVGNVRTLSRPLTVRVPGLDVEAELMSATNETYQVVQVTGSPNAKGTLKIPGLPVDAFSMTDSTHQMTLELPDGEYSAPTVTLVDSRGRRGSTRLAPFVVDTVAPTLVASSIGRRADEGVLAAVIAAEIGSTVAWRLLDDEGDVLESGEFVATSSEFAFERDLAEGQYELVATATDEHGNSVETSARSLVGPDPLTTADALIASVVLVFLLGLLAGLVLLWRRTRPRVTAWRQAREAAAALRQIEQAHAAQVAAHQQTLARYEQDMDAHRRADAGWRQRRDELAGLLELARSARGDEVPDYANVKLRRGERVYCTVLGAQVDLRSRQGTQYPTAVDTGRVTVTDARVVFNGEKKREWAYDKLEAAQHLGAETTMMKVSNRKTISGFRYIEPERTRLYLDLALADRAGTRADVIDRIGRLLHQHEQTRPQAPTPPGPPPMPPAELRTPTPTAAPARTTL